MRDQGSEGRPQVRGGGVRGVRRRGQGSKGGGVRGVRGGHR